MRKVLYLLVDLFLIVSFVLSGSVAAAQAASLTRYPYIQDLTTTSVVIAWRTEVPTNSIIQYDFIPTRDCGQYLFQVSDDSLTSNHAVTLTGLFPDTTYYYCVKSDGAVLASGESFHTATTTSNSKVTFAVTSDVHGGGKSTVALAERIKEAKADLLLVCGDLVPQHGGLGQLDGFFDSYKELIRSVPVFSCLGNHDWYEDNGESYLDEFYLPHNNPEGSELYYSFDYGNAHFVSLCVVEPEMLDWKEGSAQYNWLVNDLENTRQFWKFVYFHFPPYTSGEKYHDRYLDVRETLCPLFEKYGVDIVFNGHEHLYERTIPLRGYYEDSKGVIYIVCGAEGLLYESGVSQWTAYAEEKLRCATIVDIDGSLLNLRTVSPDGSVKDSISIDRSGELYATMEISTKAFDEKTEDRWFTVWVELSKGYEATNIDINSILLNNELKPITDPDYSFVTNPDEYLVDRDRDGLMERVLKFDRKQVAEMLDSEDGNITLKLSGSISSYGFEASSAVYVAPERSAYKMTIADIDQSGGTVETLDKQIMFSFPQGAVSDKVRLLIRQESVEDALIVPSGLKVGSTYFGLYLANNLSPDATVAIVVKYSNADLAGNGNPQFLKLLYYDIDTGEWVVLPTTIDIVAQTITTTTDYPSGKWLVVSGEAEREKLFSLPYWGWIAVAAAFLLLTVILVKRYA